MDFDAFNALVQRGAILLMASAFLMLIIMALFMVTHKTVKSPVSLFEGNPKTAYIEHCLPYSAAMDHEWLKINDEYPEKLLGEFTCQKSVWIWEPNPWTEE